MRNFDWAGALATPMFGATVMFFAAIPYKPALWPFAIGALLVAVLATIREGKPAKRKAARW